MNDIPTPSQSSWSPNRYCLTVIAVALAYFAAAKLGLEFAFSVSQVTAIFPATGIAIAALLLLGTRVWPGVFLGAFLVNATIGVGPFIAIGIAIGNTMAPLTAVFLL